MSRASPLRRRIRAAALLVAGGLLLHELIYLAVAGDLGSFLAADAHGYLAALAPLALTLAAAAICASLAPALLGPPAAGAARPCLTDRAALFAGALLAVFVVQEAGEAVLTGDPAGLLAVLGASGWVAVPLAMAIGAAAALAGEWLDRAEARLCGFVAAIAPRAPRRLGGPAPVAGRRLLSLRLGFGFARRPPPRLAVS